MKKGFTLVELLAVIVILAIIALIATPIVLNIINDFKESSIKVSMNNMEKALKMYYLSQPDFSREEFMCDDGICKTESGNKLAVSGELPDSGSITISESGKITYDSIMISGYLCEKDVDEFICRETDNKLVSSSNAYIHVEDNKGTILNNYKIYGNSTQKGIPTPAEPVEVRSVGDNALNLFSKNDYEVVELLAFSGTGTGFQIGSYSSVENSYQKVYVIKCKPNTTYTVSKKMGNFMRLFTSNEYPQPGVECQTNAIDDGRNVLSITSREDDNYLGLYLKSAGETFDDNEMLEDLIVNEGVVVTQDEPNGQYKIPVKITGKNIFNENSAYNFNASVADMLGYWEFPHVLGENRWTYIFNSKPNTTYTISSETEGDRLVVLGIDTLIEPSLDIKVIPNILFRTDLTMGLKEYTFTTTNDTKMVFVYYSKDTLPTNLQIEEATSVTEYEPYKDIITNIYLDNQLRKIGDYVDYIDFYNKKLVRNVGVLTLTGEEKWKEKDGVFYLEKHIKCGIDRDKALSTHFKYGKEDFNFWIDDKNKINIKMSSINNVEEFKEWLGDANAIIYYPLKKAIIQEIELPKITLNQDYSNLSTATSIIPSKITLEYN